MALQTFSTAPTNTSSATFRAWGSAISAAIAANGQVQTADTGQINWTTVAAPSATGTAMGYEIWRFNDALQASAPIYFKLEYGSANTFANPNMWITVGTGSDGAGTITGTFFTGIASTNQIITRTALAGSTGPAPAPSGTASNSYCNGDSSALALWQWPSFASSASGGSLLLLERSRNWDGTANGDGYILWMAFAAGTSGNTLYPVSYLANNYTPGGTTASNWQPGSGPSLNGHGATANLGGTVYAQPFFTGFNLRLGGPSQYVLCCHMGDLPGGSPYTLSHYGTARTWWNSGLGVTASGVGTVCGGMRAFLYRMS